MIYRPWLEVLRYVVDNQVATSREIADELVMSLATASSRLSKLYRWGYLIRTKDGKQFLYAGSKGGIKYLDKRRDAGDLSGY